MRRIVLALPFVLLASPAFATTIVMHGGGGRDCYLETLRDSPTAEQNAQSLRICDAAVADTRPNTDDTYDYAAALVNRADVKLRLSDYAGSVADADRAIGIDSTLGPAHLNRAAGLIGLRRFQEAMPSLDRAIALKANQLENAYYDRAIAKESMGDIRGAYYDYLEAVKANPNFDPATRELARFKVTTSGS